LKVYGHGVHAVTGETFETEYDIDGVLSEDEAQAAAAAQAITDHNDAIKAQLRDADVGMLRALFDGDTVRITAHRQAQAALRATLK